jgi:hypothetical protein
MLGMCGQRVARRRAAALENARLAREPKPTDDEETSE